MRLGFAALPRSCRLSFCALRVAGQSIPSKALADDLTHGEVEAVEILQWRTVFVLAIVIAEHLFVQVPEQVKRFRSWIIPRRLAQWRRMSSGTHVICQVSYCPVKRLSDEKPTYRIGPVPAIPGMADI